MRLSASMVTRGMAAAVDQGLFTGSSFLVNILLARWLTELEYGAFVVAYTVFLLLATIHTALLSEPLLIFGASKYSGNFRHYVGHVLVMHITLTALVAVMLVIGGFFFLRVDQPQLARAMFGLAVSAPFILLLWLTRRSLYVVLRQRLAILGGLLYFFFSLIGLYILKEVGSLAPYSALLLIGASSLMVSVFSLIVVRPAWMTSTSRLDAREVLKDHWNYGGWALLTNLLIWTTSTTYYAVLPIWAGLEGTAALQAIVNLVMPVLQGMTGVSILLLSVFARRFAVSGFDGLHSLVRRALSIFLLVGFLYSILILIFGDALLDWIYQRRYSGRTNMLLLASLLPFSYAFTFVLGGALRAIKRVKEVFRCYALSSVVTCSVGLVFIIYGGAQGAMLGLFVSSLAVAISMAVYYRSYARILGR